MKNMPENRSRLSDISTDMYTLGYRKWFLGNYIVAKQYSLEYNENLDNTANGYSRNTALCDE